MKKHMDPKTGQTGRCEAKSPDTCPVVKDLSAEEKTVFHFDSSEEAEVHESLLNRVRDRNGWSNVAKPKTKWELLRTEIVLPDGEDDPFGQGDYSAESGLVMNERELDFSAKAIRAISSGQRNLELITGGIDSNDLVAGVIIQLDNSTGHGGEIDVVEYVNDEGDEIRVLTVQGVEAYYNHATIVDTPDADNQNKLRMKVKDVRTGREVVLTPAGALVWYDKVNHDPRNTLRDGLPAVKKRYPACEKCGRVHGKSSVKATNRFDDSKPTQFVAVHTGEHKTPPRDTREEAIDDLCQLYQAGKL